jgi:murein DD-endopeptidase MepM/ murein hydrolase activator NlpD
MEKHALTAFCLISLSLFAACPRVLIAGDNVTANKKTLDEIRQQLDGKKKELEKYRQEEDLVNLELENLRKEDKLNLGRQKELESRLARARAGRTESREKSDSLSKAYKDLQGELYGETIIYSLDRQFYYPYCGRGDISRAMLLKSAILRKQSLINRIKGETERVQGDMRTFARQDLELKAQKELMDKRRSAHRNVVREKVTELERTRKKKSRLLMEVENLQNAALGLAKLVRKLEKQAPYRPGSAKSRDLPMPRHSLPWPVRGAVISRYGREEVPLLKTWIVREGIRIRAAEAAAVFPVMSGKVIYSGPFRAYGNVVIVDHAPGFFTIYGLLDGILVAKNDSVTPGSPLGRAGEDLLAVSGKTEKDYSAVYFEIRVGAEAVDPLLWLTN